MIFVRLMTGTVSVVETALGAALETLKRHLLINGLKMIWT